MSKIIKGNYNTNYGYSFSDENAKVIDTNRLVANKLEELSRIVRVQADSDDGFDEDFTQGLEAMQVERLLADNPKDESEPVSNVIKAPPPGQVQLQQARAEAEDILADANARAQEILDNANAEAQQIRDSAEAEGQRVGYDAGYEKGEMEGRAVYESQMAALQDKERQLEDEYEARVSALEPKFVEVLTDVYEHIFHVSLADKKEVIFYLIQDALRKSESGRNFIIHLSGNDYEYVLARRDELLAGLSETISAEVVEDITLGPNECFIDTGSGIFDCSVDTQLSALGKELRLLSYTPDDRLEE